MIKSTNNYSMNKCSCSFDRLVFLDDYNVVDIGECRYC